MDFVDLKEILIVLFIRENRLSINPSADNMVNCTRSVYSCFSVHLNR